MPLLARLRAITGTNFVAIYVSFIRIEGNGKLNRNFNFYILTYYQLAGRRMRRKWNKGLDNRIAETECVYIFDLNLCLDGKLLIDGYFILAWVPWWQKIGLCSFYFRGIFGLFCFVKVIVIQVIPTFPVPIHTLCHKGREGNLAREKEISRYIKQEI